jgi:hypothetical protein
MGNERRNSGGAERAPGPQIGGDRGDDHCNKLPPTDDCIGERSIEEPSDDFRQKAEAILTSYDPREGVFSLLQGEIKPAEFEWLIKRLKSLKGMKSLNLIHTQICGADFSLLAQLSLQHLDLHLCGGIRPEQLEALAQQPLQSLDLGWCGVNDADLAHIAHCPLQRLDLAGGGITDIGLAYLEDLPLRELCLAGCERITDAGLEHLARLPLRRLDLSLCRQITDAGLEHLVRLPLQQLGLGMCDNITEAGLERLKCLPLRQLDIWSCDKISDAQCVVDLLQRLIPKEVGGIPGGQLDQISVLGTLLRWYPTAEPISDAVLGERVPTKLLQLLLSLRESFTDLAAAGVVFIGRTTFGKTHAARWIAASEAEYPNLRRTLQHGDGTWGYNRNTITLNKSQHQQSELRDIYLTVLDVGGHREQLTSASNLVYMNARRSVFVLVVKATETFDEGNWGRYYLRLIQSLHLRRRSHDERGRVELYDAVQGPARSRIPVLILMTHTDEVHRIQLPDAEALGNDFPLIDLVSVTDWEAPRGNEYLPTLLRKLGQQLGKVEHLRGMTLGFIKPLMQRISETFDLAQDAGTDYWKGSESITVEEFRTICTGLGGKTEAEQDAAIRELESFGYIARTSDELRSNTRLLNPRFINYFLFQRILKDEQTRASDGFMSVSRMDELTRAIKNDLDRHTMLRLMQECLVTFEWHDPPAPDGIFVPDLLPMRASVARLELAGPLYAAVYKAEGFLREDHYFSLIAAHKERLRITEVERRPDGSRREIRVFRDECVLGDARYHGDDKYHARLTVDVIAERVKVEVIGVGEGANVAGAEKFAERVLEWLEKQAQCGFEVITRKSPVGTRKWELQDLQAKAEAFADKYGFIIPQKFFAMILSCPQSSLSTVINGKPKGNLNPSKKLLGWRTTRKRDLGRIDLRRHQSIAGAILDSTAAESNEEESAEWKDEVAAVAKLRIDDVLAELTSAESGKLKRDLEKSLKGVTEDELRHYLVTRRMCAKE